MIDSHSHLFADAFDEDRAECIKRATEAGIQKIVLPNIDFDSVEGMLELAKKYPSICYPTIGLHPTDVKEGFEVVLQKLEKEFLETSILNNIVAIGESGLDYYWDTSYINQQKEALRTQLSWAEKHSLPIILHTRDSTRDTIDEIKNFGKENVSGVFHCFSGTREEAQEVLDLGFYIGVGGTITYKKNEMRNWISDIPMKSIVLETDAPYLTPVPFRGKRNESSYIPYIAKEVASLTETEEQVVRETTTNNALRLFPRLSY